METTKFEGPLRPNRLVRKLQLRTLRAVYWLLNALLRAVAAVLWPRRRPKAVERVCIYRIGNVGDTICALPAMAAVRQAYPRAHLTLLTSPGPRQLPGAKQLLEEADWLDEIRVYCNEDIQAIRGWWTLLKELRCRAFDVWIELPNDRQALRTALRNMFFARLVGAKWGYGWRINTIHWAVQAQSEELDFPGETSRLLTIVRHSGISADAVSFPLPLTPHHERAVDSLLREHGLQGGPLLAIAPGAKRPASRWPRERFAELGSLLARRGFPVILLGGESEVGLCREIEENIGSGAKNLAGRTTLLESCALLKRCSLAICNDSGIQHLAAAVRTPCISLFSGHNIPGKWWPYGSQNVVLRRWVPCHTCYLDVCPYDNHCLKLIEVSEVVECVERKLREGKLAVPFAKVDT